METNIWRNNCDTFQEPKKNYYIMGQQNRSEDIQKSSATVSHPEHAVSWWPCSLDLVFQLPACTNRETSAATCGSPSVEGSQQASDSSAHPCHWLLIICRMYAFQRVGFCLPRDCRPAPSWINQQNFLLPSELNYIFSSKVWTPALERDHPSKFILV